MDILTTIIKKGGVLTMLPVTVYYLFAAFIIFKILDFVLGLLKVWKNGNYKSAKMRTGIIRWIAEIISVVFTIVLDLILGTGTALTIATLSLLIFKDAGSVLENLTECGVELPNIIQNKLEVFNTKDQQDMEEIKKIDKGEK